MAASTSLAAAVSPKHISHSRKHGQNCSALPRLIVSILAVDTLEWPNWRSVRRRRRRDGPPGMPVGPAVALTSCLACGMISVAFCPKQGSLMHRLVSSITSVLLAVHMAVGCCWHHAHDSCATAGCQSAHSTKVGGCGCRAIQNRSAQADVDSGDRSGGTPQPASHHCHHEQCTFTSSGSQRPLDTSDFAGTATAALATPTVLVCACEQAPVHGSATDDHRCRLGVRLHLLFSNLLI